MSTNLARVGSVLLQRAHLFVRVALNELLMTALLVCAIKLLIEMKPSLLLSRNLVRLSMAYWSRHFKLLMARLKPAILISSVLYSLKF